MVQLFRTVMHIGKHWMHKSSSEWSLLGSLGLLILLFCLSNSLACNFFDSKCRYCGASLSAGKIHSPEGFDLCNECNLSAVRNVRTAEALVAEVRSEIAKLGVKLPKKSIPIKLGPSATPGVHARCEAMRYANGNVASIWIRFVPGMPKTMFKATAAHELTHAWAYLNRSPMKQDEALSEGGPTLVEYTYLEQHPSAYGDYRRKAIMTSNNKIYGKGTRRLQAYAKDHGGLAGVLTLLKSAQTIPKGF